MANGHGGPRPNSGGPRPGAGRKPGAVTVKTRAAADRDAEDDGVEPLTLVLERMRFHAAAGDYDKAIPLAVHALPYRHARLAALTVDAEVRTAAALHIVEVVVEAAEAPKLEG